MKIMKITISPGKYKAIYHNGSFSILIWKEKTTNF